jgi:hypothetical protein
MNKRAQMEMVGLVFVVLIVILGIVLYVSFSTRDSGTSPRKEIQTYTSFLNAFGETEVQSCGLPVAQVARECAFAENNICEGDPCGALQHAMDVVLAETLKEQNIKYNMILEGTATGSSNECDSEAMPSGVFRSTLPLGADKALYLDICLR